MVTLEDEFDELRNVVDHGLRLLKLAEECGFTTLESHLRADLDEISVMALFGAIVTDGGIRERYAELVRRIDEATTKIPDSAGQKREFRANYV